ncbi:MAG TPA: methionyl-tRNA formyltransferase, partial [Firmicutes bacterium]|nr:methionyl-tRNA formyltransferase [Bacillota bacterium]
MKIIFLGTPAFAATVLDAVINSSHEVLCAVTQPDTVKGKKNVYSPLKSYCLKKGLTVYDWKNINKSGIEALKNYNADIMVTAAYGQMLSQSVLDITKHGVINVHGSVLPLFRGASPIQSAIIEGKEETGITIAQTALKMDSGDIIMQATTKIEKTDTADSLFEKLAVLGGDLLVKALNAIEGNFATFIPQNHQQATYCKKIKASDEKIEFSQPAQNVSCFIRGLSSNPGAYTFFNGKRLKIYNCFQTQTEQNLKAGQLFYTKKELIIGCGIGAISVIDLQLSESKRMKTADFLNGLKNRPQFLG